MDAARFRRWGRQFSAMAGLAALLGATYSFAYLVRFEGDIQNAYRGVLLATLPLILAVKMAIFVSSGRNLLSSRHLTFQDLTLLVRLVTLSSAAVAIACFFVPLATSVPRSVLLIDWGITILGFGGVRAGFRFWREVKPRLQRRQAGHRVLIVGDGDSAEALVRMLKLNGRMAYDVVGFVKSRADKRGLRIGGLRDLGALSKTGQIASDLGVAEVFIAGGDVSTRDIRHVVEQCQERDLKYRVVPGYEELLAGQIVFGPRPVPIDDLLRREPAQLDTDHISQIIKGQTIMVTGSAGSIGSEICRQLLKYEPEQLILVDQAETPQFHIERELAALKTGVPLRVCIADIRDLNRMRSVMFRYKPAVLFHAAAYKHVPMMESNAGEAVKNTTLATFNLANLAEQFGVSSFVMISTDKAVNPTNVMGACKRVAEQYIQALSSTARCRFVTVRFGNVLDSAGSVVPIFRDQIARGGPITVTDQRIERYFMTIPEAAQLVIQAGTMGRGGEIFVLDMGKPVRIVQLAEEMIRLSGLTPGEDIEIHFTGLRPGEKLYEELQVVGEKHCETKHKKIMVVECKHQDLQEIKASIESLRLIVEQPVDAIVEELKRVLPEYRQTVDQAARDKKAA